MVLRHPLLVLRHPLLSPFTISAARGAASTYFDIKPGVILPPDIEDKVAEIGKRYYEATGKRITVTDGTRTPEDQANRVYDQIVEDGVEDPLGLYTNKELINPIVQAYTDGKKLNKSKAELLKAMAKVIQGQVNRKEYLSKHLIAGAVDIRVSDMKTAFLKNAFRAAANGIAKKVLLENVPPHWHLSFK